MDNVPTTLLGLSWLIACEFRSALDLGPSVTCGFGRLYRSGDGLTGAPDPSELLEDDASLLCAEWGRGALLPRLLPGMGRTESSLDPPTCKFITPVPGKLVMDALAEYRGRALAAWL